MSPGWAAFTIRCIAGSSVGALAPFRARTAGRAASLRKALALPVGSRIHGLPRFGGYDSCLVVTCGLPRFTRVFPCNKNITGKQTVKMLVEQWFEPYGAPKQVHSNEDVRIHSDTGWYKRVLNALNVQVTTGVPYTHTSHPLCERQNRFVEHNLRILMKREHTKHWVRLVPWAVLTMNSQHIH